MISKSKAKELVAKELEIKNQNHNDDLELVVLDEETIEKEWGWVFFYQNKKYLESGDFRDMVGGNASYIVNKYTGELIVTGTAHEIEYYIEEYESTL